MRQPRQILSLYLDRKAEIADSSLLYLKLAVGTLGHVHHSPGVGVSLALGVSPSPFILRLFFFFFGTTAGFEP